MSLTITYHTEHSVCSLAEFPGTLAEARRMAGAALRANPEFTHAEIYRTAKVATLRRRVRRPAKESP